MANTPKKMKDPTEAALSAIQDALQIRDDDTPAQQNSAPTPAPASGPSEEKPWPGLRSKLSNRETARENAKPAQTPYERAPYEEERAVDPMRLPAANDDRESIGSILRLLQQTPSKTSYLIASIFAAVWVVGGFALGWLYLPSSRRRSARPASPRRCLPCLARSISPPWSSSTCSPTWPGGRRNCG